MMSEKKKRICISQKSRLENKVETKEINELSTHISTNNIMELNELYAREKLVCGKIGGPKKNTCKFLKPG